MARSGEALGSHRSRETSGGNLQFFREMTMNRRHFVAVCSQEVRSQGWLQLHELHSLRKRN